MIKITAVVATCVNSKCPFEHFQPYFTLFSEVNMWNQPLGLWFYIGPLWFNTFQRQQAMAKQFIWYDSRCNLSNSNCQNNSIKRGWCESAVNMSVMQPLPEPSFIVSTKCSTVSSMIRVKRWKYANRIASNQMVMCVNNNKTNLFDGDIPLCG